MGNLRFYFSNGIIVVVECKSATIVRHINQRIIKRLKKFFWRGFGRGEIEKSPADKNG